MRVASAALLLAAAGCGAERPEPPAELDPLGAFVESSGVDFAPCGRILYDTPRTCPEGYEAAARCFADAEAACTPARLLVERSTAIGSSTVDHLFVRPEGDGCAVWLFLDERDENDCPVWLRRRCEGLRVELAQCGAPAGTSCDEGLSLDQGTGCTDAE